VQQYKPDVLVAEHSYSGWIAIVLRRATGVPFIIHSHNLEALRFRQMNRRWWPLYARYERWIHRQADHNFFISTADEAYAVKHFKLDAAKCTTITYGIEPNVTLNTNERDSVLKETGLWGFEKVLYFNGTLDYKPNVDAVLVLLHAILPLLQKAVPEVKLVITGNRASTALQETLRQHPQVLFKAYVPDVRPYYQAAQLFLNPIREVSGVKTKLIEAIASHCTVISTEAGAAGIDKTVCGTKLVTVADNDWTSFTALVVQELHKPQQQTSAAFFEAYSWQTITAKAAQKIKAVAHDYGI
jgi:glycosyltransferase involved in cell wall biosynthesis